MLHDVYLLRTGLIVLYRLFHNGIVIYNSSSACNVTLAHQDTWSAHEFRVEACTAVGCTSSASVLARTQPQPPEGLVGITANVTSQRTVRVHWTPVTAANGQLRYDVYFTGPFYTEQSTTTFDVRSVSFLASFHGEPETSVDSIPPYKWLISMKKCIVIDIR